MVECFVVVGHLRTSEAGEVLRILSEFSSIIRLELFTIFQVSKILSRFSSRKIYFFCQDYNSKTTRPTLDLVFGNPREIYFYLRKIKKVSFLFGVCGEHGKLGLYILREEIFLQLSN